MELAIGKADFARALASVSKAIEARNTIPILGCVRLAAEDGTLRVRGTDLDIEVTDTAPADIVTPGALCVEAKLLSSIVAKAGGDILLAERDGKLVIKSGRSRFTLAVLPASDFPEMPDADYAATFEIDLAAMFAPCVHAISSEETRYYLNGIYFASDGETTVAVATDGHRLVRHKGEALPPFSGVIAPRKLVGMLPKGGVQVSVSNSKIRLVQDGLTIISKLIDGTFPDYERVIPRSNAVKFAADREELMRAADRVVTISTERGRGVKLSLAPGSLVLSARSDVGDAQDEVAIDYSGEPHDVGFNSQYLRDMLATLPAGKVEFAVDGGAPGLVSHPDVPAWTGVIMPMRV